MAAKSSFYMLCALSLLGSTSMAQATPSKGTETIITNWGTIDASKLDSAGDFFRSAQTDHSADNFSSFADIFSFHLDSPFAVSTGIDYLFGTQTSSKKGGGSKTTVTSDTQNGTLEFFQGVFSQFDQNGKPQGAASLAHDVFNKNKSAMIGFDDLAAGDYFFVVSGKINGTKQGSYSWNTTITPVPEPETYAMLLAGLGVICIALRRRVR